MKSLFVFAMILTSLTTSAQACLDREQKLVCPGDSVVVEYLSGTVIGINPIKKEASIRFSNGATNSYSIERVAVGKGCLAGLCVGASATVDTMSGTILAVNKIQAEVSIQFSNGSINSYKLERVTSGKGCLEGFCVGNAATVETLSGTIVGVNKSTGKISITFSNGATQTYEKSRVTIGKGCMLGYCVGDNATVEWLSGRLVGINPSTLKASILFTNGAIRTYDLSRVSTDGFCLEYDQNDRRRWIGSEEFGTTFSN